MPEPRIRSLADSVGAKALAIRSEMKGTTAVLTFHGELVYGCVPVLEHALDKLPRTSTELVLDMADVSFMDSSGLEFLVRLQEYSDLGDLPVRTVNWRGQPLRVLEITGVSEVVADLGSDARPAAPPPSEEGLHASGAAVERAEQVDHLQEEVRQLHQAIESRPVIDQARGIIMAVEACGAEDAWAILREASQHTNMKLKTVATAVVTSVDGDAPAEPLRRALNDAAVRRRRRARRGGEGTPSGTEQ
ncbi:ANTAR domain-containing protein [Streptomyces sp. NPDC005648]|uniref:ANTAR domain-containing response regulator n=1 Tax=Streptomyces sp. NPDC005648 TaxID=3157044 RepID=UPI0033BC8DA7